MCGVLAADGRAKKERRHPIGHDRVDDPAAAWSWPSARRACSSPEQTGTMPVRLGLPMFEPSTDLMNVPFTDLMNVMGTRSSPNATRSAKNGIPVCFAVAVAMSTTLIGGCGDGG